MSLPHWAYVAMLAFCLAGTLPLVPAFRLQVLKQPGRLLLTIGLAGTPFLLWDLWATHVGHWWFDEDQTLPVAHRGPAARGDRLLRGHPGRVGADARGRPRGAARRTTRGSAVPRGREVSSP